MLLYCSGGAKLSPHDIDWICGVDIFLECQYHAIYIVAMPFQFPPTPYLLQNTLRDPNRALAIAIMPLYSQFSEFQVRDEQPCSVHRTIDTAPARDISKLMATTVQRYEWRARSCVLVRSVCAVTTIASAVTVRSKSLADHMMSRSVT
jgi:hypothetical protein